jgi:hypothetical protein
MQKINLIAFAAVAHTADGKPLIFFLFYALLGKFPPPMGCLARALWPILAPRR